MSREAYNGSAGRLALPVQSKTEKYRIPFIDRWFTFLVNQSYNFFKRGKNLTLAAGSRSMCNLLARYGLRPDTLPERDVESRLRNHLF